MLYRTVLRLCVSVLCTLGAGEVWLRWQSPEATGFEYVKGEFKRPQEFVRDKSINRLGFHDVEPAPKELVGIRVILLGDSYVEARSMSVTGTVGQRLASHLSDGHGRRVDVISIGVGGWGQEQQLNALRKYGPRFQPDLVVTLFISLNDVRDNYRPLEGPAREQINRMVGIRPGWVNLKKEKAPFFWFEGSALNRVMSHRLTVLLSQHRDREIPLDYFVYSDPYTPDWEEAWRTTNRLFGQTQTFCRSLGSGYAIVSGSTLHGVSGQKDGLDLLARNFPSMNKHDWKLDKPDRLLGQVADAHDIPFLALEPIFHEMTKQGTVLHWRFNGHWNEAGNDEAGKRIAGFLMSRGLISCSDRSEP